MDHPGQTSIDRHLTTRTVTSKVEELGGALADSHSEILPTPLKAAMSSLPCVQRQCHDFRRFPPFSLPKSQAPTLIHLTHDMFSPFLSYTVFILSYLFLSSHRLLSYLLNRSFRISRTIRSIWHTWRLVSLGLPKESYLLGSHQPIKLLKCDSVSHDL